jgi:hypothetical protein
MIVVVGRGGREGGFITTTTAVAGEAVFEALEFGFDRVGGGGGRVGGMVGGGSGCVFVFGFVFVFFYVVVAVGRDVGDVTLEVGFVVGCDEAWGGGVVAV